MSRHLPLMRAVAVLALCLLSTACSPSSDNPAAAGRGGAARAVRLPDTSGGFDYQLGGKYSPPSGVTIVERDRTADPSGAGYDICYVNGFQTQPDESEAFVVAHPELFVQTGAGPLVDEGWPDEYLFDTSTADKRAALAELVGEWIDGCAADGFAAVEIDNLDSYPRSGGALTVDDNLALAATYAQRAHAAGLAIAQKNTVDQVSALRARGYDFAVTESCSEFEEHHGVHRGVPRGARHRVRRIRARSLALQAVGGGGPEDASPLTGGGYSGTSPATPEQFCATPRGGRASAAAHPDTRH
ncbi:MULTISPECIES: endo alpha-1,4 polygalactosaminidase [Microbacterium]|uniref:endo alpha-1,4 polygalactosaminidase n=1 Tax=Microbacterium TaxID=33882 RepID=UPI00277FEC70|nr:MULTISPECIES: endo alpha-1,4 polygalactosaminidase [Microbacterium]MDQ1082261.1 hypothetical protein [Microbacterium sp. SORGH_AS_0344]MDQ1168968.1 hypothetical protein [Microbacterium proteolyticum]